MNIYFGYLRPNPPHAGVYYGYFDIMSMELWDRPQNADKAYVYYLHMDEMYEEHASSEDKSRYLNDLYEYFEDSVIEDYLLGRTAESITLLLPDVFIGQDKTAELLKVSLSNKNIKGVQVISPRSFTNCYDTVMVSISYGDDGEPTLTLNSDYLS